jgi:hypothetical protein
MRILPAIEDATSVEKKVERKKTDAAITRDRFIRMPLTAAAAGSAKHISVAPISINCVPQTGFQRALKTGSVKFLYSLHLLRHVSLPGIPRKD